MPRADPLPASDSEIGEVPSTTNPLAERGGIPDALGHRHQLNMLDDKPVRA